jgi:ribose transport system ATP-binding protein
LDDDILVRAQGLTVKYGATAALDSVDLTLARGEILGVVGTNGAGKSTLLGVLSGALRPDAGRMWIAGEPFSPDSVEEARAGGVGYVPQRIEIDPRLTVADAIFRTSFRRTLPAAQRLTEATEILARYRVLIRADELIGQLAPAELANVELLRLACEETQVIILDEVSATFDDYEIATFHALAHRLADDGRALIHVSHRIDEIHALSDRIMVLRAGRLHRILYSREATRIHVVGEMFGRVFAHRPRFPAPGDPVELMTLEQVSSGPRVRGVSLDIRAGEVLGITGLRRSGISEIAELLAGLRAPQAGRVLTRGTPVDSAEDLTQLHARVAYLPERDGERDLDESETVTHSLIGEVSEIAGGFAGEVKRLREVVATVQRFGIRTTGIHGAVGTLSGGDKQKVALARTLSHPAEVCVLNQPTRGIDEQARQSVYALLDEVCARGAAVVLITSDMTELVDRAHRIAVMRDGELVHVEDNDGLTEDAVMVHALGSRFSTVGAPPA